MQLISLRQTFSPRETSFVKKKNNFSKELLLPLKYVGKLSIMKPACDARTFAKHLATKVPF